jgi:hypothetical protein
MNRFVGYPQNVLLPHGPTRSTMTKYFGLWKVETSLQPQDPRMAIQLYQAFAAQLKRDLDSGDIKESNSFLEGNGGYFVSGDITQERLHALLLSWAPYLTFEVHQTVPALKTVENLIGIAKQRATVMTVPA